MQTLQGGNGDDDFEFIGDGTFSGLIDGGSGDNTLDYSQTSLAPLQVALNKDGSENGVQGTGTGLGSFDNIDTINGGSAADSIVGNFTAGATYSGNFSHTLSVSGFANMELNVAGDFSGELKAGTEGTAAAPVSSIAVGRDFTASGIIKVDFLVNFTVAGEMYGLIKAYGNNPSVASIQAIAISGSLHSGAVIWGNTYTVEEKKDFAGYLDEQSVTGDFHNLVIGGSFLPSGLIEAASGGTLSVTGDFAGKAVLAGGARHPERGEYPQRYRVRGQYQPRGPGRASNGTHLHRPLDGPSGECCSGRRRGADPGHRSGEPNYQPAEHHQPRPGGSTYVLTAPDNDWYGPNGLPAIASNVTINGNGAIIEATGASHCRIFYVSGGFDTLPAGSLALNNLTLEGGLAVGGAGGKAWPPAAAGPAWAAQSSTRDRSTCPA